MSKRISLNVEGNLGYGADQMNRPVTLADLLEQVQEAIVEWGEDAEVVVYQINNRYGASYGQLARGYELFDATDNYEDGEGGEDDE